MRPADYLVVAAALATVIALALYAWTPARLPDRVEIRSRAGIVELPLERDALHTIKGPLGDSVVEVRAHRVRFAAAPCSNRICLAAGWLERADEVAVCVPNGVSLRVRGPAQRFDAINY